MAWLEIVWQAQATGELAEAYAAADNRPAEHHCFHKNQSERLVPRRANKYFALREVALDFGVRNLACKNDAIAEWRTRMQGAKSAREIAAVGLGLVFADQNEASALELRAERRNDLKQHVNPFARLKAPGKQHVNKAIITLGSYVD